MTTGLISSGLEGSDQGAHVDFRLVSHMEFLLLILKKKKSFKKRLKQNKTNSVFELTGL